VLTIFLLHLPVLPLKNPLRTGTVTWDTLS